MMAEWILWREKKRAFYIRVLALAVLLGSPFLAIRLTDFIVCFSFSDNWLFSTGIAKPRELTAQGVLRRGTKDSTAVSFISRFTDKSKILKKRWRMKAALFDMFFWDSWTEGLTVPWLSWKTGMSQKSCCLMNPYASRILERFCLICCQCNFEMSLFLTWRRDKSINILHW